MVGESQEPVGAGVGSSSTTGSNKTPTLQEYGTNLTTQAAEVRAGACGRAPLERLRRLCAPSGVSPDATPHDDPDPIARACAHRASWTLW